MKTFVPVSLCDLARAKANGAIQCFQLRSAMSNERVHDGNASRLFVPYDIVATGTELFAMLSARFLSPNRADRVTGQLARILLWLQAAKREKIMSDYQTIMGDFMNEMPTPERYAEDLITAHLREHMINNRLGVTPSWRPVNGIAVSGVEAVEAAHKGGRGVVLWWLPLEDMQWVMRVVAHDRGWVYHHISHFAHGPSPTRYGQAFLNPRIHRIEEQFCKRLVLSRTGARPALEEAKRILADGGIVGFRGLGRGRRSLSFPFFEGNMRVAVGAPVTAIRSGAALFTVALALDTEDGYEITFEEMPYDAEAGPEPLARQFAQRFEAAVRRTPALWSVLRPQCTPGPAPVLVEELKFSKMGAN